MIRLSPLALAWARAKAREATVFPPPVGTVRVNRTGGWVLPIRIHCSRTAQRREFSSP